MSQAMNGDDKPRDGQCRLSRARLKMLPTRPKLRGCASSREIAKERLWAGTVERLYITSIVSNSRRYVSSWRMGRDSNPRDACASAGFQDRCLQPLGHPSRKDFKGLSRATNRELPPDCHRQRRISGSASSRHSRSKARPRSHTPCAIALWLRDALLVAPDCGRPSLPRLPP
jgi:hypothetical protein